MGFEGSQVQNAIYVSGESPWPVSPEEWEARAAEALEPGPFDYIAGGAGSESTMRANLEAFERRRLRPRMLRGNREREIYVDVLGTSSPAPFLLAPIGVLSIAHPEAELAVARAAAATGIPMVLSSAASHSLEEVAEAGGDAPRWFQLYWINDRDVAVSLVERAEAAGCDALVLTVDAPVLGRRERDVRTGFRVPEDITVPSVATALGRWEGATPLELLAGIDSTLTWDDLEELRSLSPLPLVLKGIQTAEDAELACEHGVDAIVVSNHGGRQLDAVAPTAELLPEIVEAVAGRLEVYVDGGVRRGSDVVKALALGARAVLVGRAPLWGLACDGEAGARRVLDLLRAEIELVLALCGCTTPDAITREHVTAIRSPA
jgi:(S)-2-hydroxy-acid oxidase/4-hydroxymandelate oxidase